MGRLEKIPTASRSTAQILAEGFKDCFPKDGKVGGLLVLSGPPDINLKGKNPNALNRTRVPAKGGITVGKQGVCNELEALVNRERTKSGLSPLHCDAYMRWVADYHLWDAEAEVLARIWLGETSATCPAVTHMVMQMQSACGANPLT